MNFLKFIAVSVAALAFTVSAQAQDTAFSKEKTLSPKTSKILREVADERGHPCPAPTKADLKAGVHPDACVNAPVYMQGNSGCRQVRVNATECWNDNTMRISNNQSSSTDSNSSNNNTSESSMLTNFGVKESKYVVGRKPGGFSALIEQPKEPEYIWCKTIQLANVAQESCYPATLSNHYPLPKNAPSSMFISNSGVAIKCYKKTANVVDPTPEKAPSLGISATPNYVVRIDYARVEDYNCEGFKAAAIKAEQFRQNGHMLVALHDPFVGATLVDMVADSTQADRTAYCTQVDPLIIRSVPRLAQLCSNK